jgi:magnesium-transporting ATPase (P-type)
LRNTEYCYGIVIYVGNNTKIMKNAKKPPRKISHLMKLMNFMLYTVFAFQIGIITVFASLYLMWTSENATEHTYLNLSSEVGIKTWIV